MSRSRFAVGCRSFLSAVLVFTGSALAQTPTVTHDPAAGLPSTNVSFPTGQSFNGAPTQRVPLTPRESETVGVNFQVCCQNGYDRTAVYFTTDGSEPQGQVGIGSGATQVLLSSAGQVTFIANDFNVSPGVRDWWRATLPASTRGYGVTVRYKLSRWSSSTGAASEVFNGGASLSTGAPAFSFTNKLPWPGAGAGSGNPAIGYPAANFWKEEGVVGNNFINSMLDQNGTWFDIYYPGAGGVQGVSTRAEGYSNGLDTFPPLLPADRRGQMHLNQMMVGIRADGLTHWTSNPGAVSFDQVTQEYLADTQTIRSRSRLFAAGNNIEVEQLDFAPKGITFPANGNRGILIKRLLLTNRNATEDVDVYLYLDPAINGGDTYDFMYHDPSVGAMIAGDNAFRNVTGTGCCFPGSNEYNPTTFSGYDKDISLFFGAAMKKLTAVGGAAGTFAADSWRDTSADNGQGWIGQRVALPQNVTVELNFIIIGGVARPAGAQGGLPPQPGVYSDQIRPVIDWFAGESAQSLQGVTDLFWQNFLAQGVLLTTPDARLNTLFRRGILGTMLHFDEAQGGLIAGFRNGAYPYVWPRDMAWAGVTLARAGHTDTVRAMTRYLRDITFREFETWTPGNTPPVEAAGGSPFYGTRKGFWKQKYTTDGYVVWGAPQVDETAVFPWMVKYLYDVTGDVNYLLEAEVGNPANTTYAAVKDAAIAMSQTSKNDPTRLNHRPSYPGASSLLMYSNNIWEDQYDTFIYSNANIVRGLRDAASIAGILGLTADAADFNTRAGGILAGLNDKLDWNRENTDASLLGIVYPFETHAPTDPRAVRVIDRINGVAADGNGQVKPLVRFATGPQGPINVSSDYVDLIDRYYGDGYWGNSALGPTPAGPWFLTTLWYGCYYAARADFTSGTGDIDNHYYRLNRTADHNGPLGFGAEQMAPSNSLMYPGQSDFTLQTAWPNAWESMSFYVDAAMQFIDYTPNAAANTLRIRPKLPSAWPSMTVSGLEVRDRRITVEVAQSGTTQTQTFTNTTGGTLAANTTLKAPPGKGICALTINGVPAFYTLDTATNTAELPFFNLSSAVNGQTVVQIRWKDGLSGDWNRSGQVDADDIFAFLNGWFLEIGLPGSTDVNNSGIVDADDIFFFLNLWFDFCP